MTGKEIKLGKLFSNGKPVIVAADHGSYMGPFKGIEDLPAQIHKFKKADAFLIMPGMAKRCKEFFSDKNSPLCIIRINWASHYCKLYADLYKKGCNEKFNSVEYAMSLGADIIIVSLLLGTDEDTNVRNIEQFGALIEDADRLGIPVIGEYIPLGGIDQYDGAIKSLLLGTRACAELGADLIKTVYVEEFEEIVGSSVIPVFALGGAKTDRPFDSFSIAQKSIQKGAAGVVFGRNVICAANPEKYLDCLRAVVKEGLSAEEAEQMYLNAIK